jgi:hypothetical protein
MRTVIIATSAAGALFSSPALTQQLTQGTASIPDFSGVWAHPSGYVEPLASGPRPVLNRAHRDGKNDPYLTVGDYTNPILKPVAAQVVKKHGEISLAGLANPTPSTHCWPSGVPYIFFNLACRYYNRRTRSLSFTCGIMNSARAPEPASCGARDALVVRGFGGVL